jgi:hypothetical protein
MPSGRDASIDNREFIVAVRERHEGVLSEGAHLARLALGEEYLEADLAVGAVEVLLCAVTDSSRLYGPADERTLRTRLRLGDAYVAAGRLHDAYGIHWNLVAEADEAFGSEHEVSRQVRAAAQRTEALFGASGTPL